MRSRSLSSDAPRMRTASSPALRAPPIDTVATGTPAGIWTIESSESIPSRCCNGTGTPITGSGVAEATIPGRCAAPPAPAITTRSPRSAAVRAYSSIASGVRCADTTRTSYATANSSIASAAACITGQSESEPMMTPTSGIAPLPQPAGGVRGARPYLVQVVAEHRHVTDLASGPDPLAVQVDPRLRHSGEHVVQPLVQGHRSAVRAAEHVRHHGHRRGRRRVAQRVVEDRAQVLLELRGTPALDRP